MLMRVSRPQLLQQLALLLRLPWRRLLLRASELAWQHFPVLQRQRPHHQHRPLPLHLPRPRI